MMVMWSEYDGSDDAGGDGVTSYMEDEVVWKPTPDGGRHRIRRVPPPEVLAGDSALMRQAIRAVPFQRKYSSGVLSFADDDIDVAAFNAGDPDLRRRVAEMIEEFEGTAYGGIPEEYRPPTFWTTHSHTGRLECNFCMPRALIAGTGQLRSINPHPPGAASLKLFDAFRDVFNSRYGWADPEAPDRARWTLGEPNWAMKLAAEAARAGHQSKKLDTEAISQSAGKLAEAAFRAGQIRCRDDLVHQLKAAGFDVPRVGPHYITIATPGGHRTRLRGRLFSASFTSPEVLEPPADAPPRLDLAECEARLATHQARRALFHQRRYGGPGWEPPAVSTGPDEPPPMEPIVEPEPAPTAKQLGARHRPRPKPNWLPPTLVRSIGDGQIEPAIDDARQRYKARLWLLIFGGTLPDEILMALRHVDRNTRTVRLADGAVVIDHGERISSTHTTELAIKLMVAEAHAKGWRRLTVAGSAEFQRLATAEAQRAGLVVTNPELQHLVGSMTEGRNEGPDADGARAATDSRSLAGRDDGTRRAADDADRRLDGATGRLERSMRRLGRAARPRAASVLDDRAEVARFKADIDLCAVAASVGFAVDGKAGDRNHVVMRHGDGTKIIIGVSEAGHWVFSSNVGQAGSVIDLLQWRQRLNLGQVRHWLRPWLGEGANHPRIDPLVYTPRPKPVPTPADAMKALAEWESANSTDRSVFLERSRGIVSATLASNRFAGTFRVDERQNAVFPYRTRGGIVGTERRNRPPAESGKSFKVYSAGGAPGIWVSNGTAKDFRLVVVESPIDAMAHWQMLSPPEQAITRYAAIRAGCAEEDLAALIATMPPGATVVAACDGDDQGRKYNAWVRDVAARQGTTCTTESPSHGDWNEDLQAQRAEPSSNIRPRPK